jgi:serine/threonine protein kinase
MPLDISPGLLVLALPTASQSLTQQVGVYLPIAEGFAMLFLLFGGVALLTTLVRYRRLSQSLSGNLVTGLFPSGPLPQHKKPGPLVIGSYRVISILGTGGMGTVYKAVDAQGGNVAIKTIGGVGLKGTALMLQKKNLDARIGLVREARLAAELSHPNIVKVFDIGQNKGALYVVMELLEGMPLDLYARTHPISAPEALRIVAQLCEALDCAHNHGIIHRDVKPANTFIMADGTVKVLDFGIALPSDHVKSLGAVVGTPLYMSPEQLLGQEVDARTDIWSAGVTLFQLLTTRMPFQGRSTSELLANILNSPSPKLPFAGPFAEDLNVLLKKSLAKNRESRYDSAREFANDLRSVNQKLQKIEVGIEKSHLSDISTAVRGGPLIPSTYKPIQLGFHTQIKNPVYLFPVPKKGAIPVPDISQIVYQLGASGLAALAFFYGFAILPILGFFVILIAAWLCLGQLFKFFRPDPFYCCRSCKRRMSSISAWSRPTRLSEQNSFCGSDCIAALKSGLWEEAVKLLWIHTSEEKSDRHYKLQFFECIKCSDQRAYLTLQIGGELRGLREAYRFGISDNAQRYFATVQSSQQWLPSPPGAVPPPRALEDTEAHNQPTI